MLTGLLAIIALFLVNGSGIAIQDSRFIVEDITHRSVAPADDDGDIRLSIRVPVQNLTTEDLLVFVEIQSLDDEGFEVHQESVSGIVYSGSTQYLSDWLYLQETAFLTIEKWEVLSIEGYELSPNASLLHGVHVSEMSRKVIEKEDEDGDVLYAIKVQVTNLGEYSQNVTLAIKVIDDDKYVLDSWSMKCSVDVGERVDLTDSAYLPKNAYESILKMSSEVQKVEPSNNTIQLDRPPAGR